MSKYYAIVAPSLKGAAWGIGESEEEARADADQYVTGGARAAGGRPIRITKQSYEAIEEGNPAAVRPSAHSPLLNDWMTANPEPPEVPATAAQKAAMAANGSRGGRPPKWSYERAEAKEKLVGLQGSVDHVAAHVKADNIMLHLLAKLGFGDVVAEYEKIDRRY